MTALRLLELIDIQSTQIPITVIIDTDQFSYHNHLNGRDKFPTQVNDFKIET